MQLWPWLSHRGHRTEVGSNWLAKIRMSSGGEVQDEGFARTGCTGNAEPAKMHGHGQPKGAGIEEGTWAGSEPRGGESREEAGGVVEGLCPQSGGHHQGAQVRKVVRKCLARNMGDLLALARKPPSKRGCIS